MSISGLFKRSKTKDRAHRLYTAVVEQAREPAFYRHWGVPDTVDGRFEMILIHTTLLLRRLRGLDEAGTDLGQVMFDVMIDDMDQSLREMGVGDLAVGRRVKAMAKAYFGRSVAYDAGLAEAEDGDLLQDALARNLYGTVTAHDDDLRAIAAYMRGQMQALEDQPAAGLLDGIVVFGEAPRHEP